MFVGLETRRSTAGPLAHSPEDIELFMAAYMAQKPWDVDQDVLPIPWRKAEEVMPLGQLCFAVAWGDEEVSALGFATSDLG
jgi:Asp-tRNA(Asn)/Glu-tRNA(Gln) amidotransferase A subunit family amidase